jgi:drug/metabolite transporter (DMT)-like permease
MISGKEEWRMIILFYLLMCFIFGTTFLAIKIGVDAGIPPFFGAGLRFFSAGFLLFLFMRWKDRVSLKILFRKELFFTGVGLTFGTFATLYWAEQYVSSGVAAVLSATGPMMILIISSLLLKQKTSHTSMIGCMIGLAGVVVLILPSISLNVHFLWIMGCLAIVVGEVFYASGTIYTKQVKEKIVASPLVLNAVQMMHGGFLLLLLSLITEKVQPSSLIHTASIGSLLYLIIIGSMVGHSLYYWLVTKTDPVFPSTWLYISPLIAVGLGVTFYQEEMTWYTGIGAATILLGTILVNYPALQSLLWKKTLSQKG